MATAATDPDSSVEMDCLSDNVIKPYNADAYDDSENTAVSEPGRFDVDTASGTAAITIGISHSLQNYVEWYEARANSIMLIILLRPTQRILIMSTAISS